MGRKSDGTFPCTAIVYSGGYAVNMVSWDSSEASKGNRKEEENRENGVCEARGKKEEKEKSGLRFMSVASAAAQKAHSWW